MPQVTAQHLPLSEETLVQILLKDQILASWKSSNNGQEIVHLHVPEEIRKQILDAMKIDGKSHNKQSSGIALFQQQKLSIQDMILLVCCGWSLKVANKRDKALGMGHYENVLAVQRAPVIECRYCNRCVSLSLYGYKTDAFVSCENETMPMFGKNMFNKEKEEERNEELKCDHLITADRNQPEKPNKDPIKKSIDHNLYKTDTNFITLQLSKLGLTLHPFVNRRVDLDIYPTLALQSQADFDKSSIGRNTISNNQDHHYNSFRGNANDSFMRTSTEQQQQHESYKWPRRSYLDNVPDEFDLPEQKKESRKRKLSELHADDNPMEHECLSLRTRKDTLIDKDREIIAPSNKRIKVLETTTTTKIQHDDENKTPPRSRKRKLTELMEDIENDPHNNIDESNVERKKRKKHLSQHDTSSVGELIMQEPLQMEENQIENNNDTTSIQKKRGRKRKLNELEEFVENNSSEAKDDIKRNDEINVKNNFDIQQDDRDKRLKRRRCAESDTNNVVFNPINEHKCDCPYVQLHQYLGQSMTGWEYCAIIVARNMKEFIEH